MTPLAANSLYRKAMLVAGGAALVGATQLLFSEGTLGWLSGRAPPTVPDLGPLWTPYCRPSEAVLLRASRGPDVGAWVFENLGDLLALLVTIVALQAVLGRPPQPPRRAARLLGGPLGLSARGLLALSSAVLLFDLAYLIPPRNVVLWEIASDLGILSSALLIAHVAHAPLWRWRPHWLAAPRMDLLLGLSAAALCAVLLAGGFLTARFPPSWGTVGPRWPLVVFLVAGSWRLLTHLRSRASPPPTAVPADPSAAFRWQNLTLALVALVLALAVVEAGARWVLAGIDYDLRAAEVRSVPQRPTPRGDSDFPKLAVELSRLLRPSANPRRVYELRPNLAEEISLPGLSATEFRTNSFGMRGPEVSREKPPGTVRIAGLGDSVMFGWGVRYQDTHLALLGRMLQQRDPGNRYQVLNFGVPGYNTVMERESYLELARQFSPDLVVLTVVANDADLPNFLQRPRNAACLHRAFFSGLLHRALIGTDPYAAHEILVAQSYDFDRSRFEAERGRTPVGSEILSGTENALAALHRLHQDVRASGARLVLTVDYEDLDSALDPSHPKPPAGLRETMLQAASEWGIPVADPRPRVVRHLRRNGLRSADLWVGPRDRHPSPTRHRLTAEEILAVAPGLLEEARAE